MSSRRRTLHRGLALAVGLIVGAACNDGSSAGPSQRSGFDQTLAHYGAWNGGLADTTPAPPVPLPQTVITATNGNNWICQNTQFDEKRNLDQLLSPGATAGVLWPGALIQGASLIAGTPAEIPLPRSPITISIDLAVDTATVRIATPTSASVQAAVADLQRQADARLGPIDVVPARLDFKEAEAFNSQQTKVDVGLYGNFPLEGADVSASVGVSVGTSFQQHTIAVTMIQPMYTISFADEEKPDPNAYLDSSVTPAQVQDVVTRGLISGSNLPTYVKSVTYGRVLVFTITNNTAASAVDVEVAVAATVDQYGGGANVSVQDSNLLKTSDIHIQVFGGSQDSALAAIRSGDLGKFFTAVPATQAVPLSYRINYLKDGTVALLGAEAKFTKSDCANAGTSARYWTFTLDSLTATGCPDTVKLQRDANLFEVSDTFNLSSLITIHDLEIGSESNNTGSLPTTVWYHMLDSLSLLGPPKDTTVKTAIVVALPTSGAGAFVAGSEFKDSFCEGLLFGPCEVLRVFRAGDQLPTTPYSFTQFISLPGPNTGCVATFFWEVSTQPVLAPPVRTPARESGAARHRGAGRRAVTSS